MPQFLGFDYATPLSITNNEPRFITDTQSLRRYSARTGAQRWELSISFVGGKNQDLSSAFQSHYMQFGSELAFNLPMPQNKYAESRLTIADVDNNLVAVRVSRDASANDQFVYIQDTENNIPYLIPNGYFINFSGHSKVYQVLEDASAGIEENTSDTDEIQLKIGPRLQSNISAGTLLILQNVNISVKHELVNTNITYSDGLMQRSTLNFVENLT